jgi:hypothetical protein
MKAIISRTASEWHRVGLRVSDREGGAKRNIALERRRWLKSLLDGPLGRELTTSRGA